MVEENPENPPAGTLAFAEALTPEGQDQKQHLEKAATDLQIEMEAASEQIRALVLAQPPTSLLGYLWSQFFMGVLQHHKKKGDEAGLDSDLIKKFQFVLEYVHAVWSAHKGEFVQGQLMRARPRTCSPYATNSATLRCSTRWPAAKSGHSRSLAKQRQKWNFRPRPLGS